MQKTNTHVGTHSLIDLYGISVELACDVARIQQILLQAAQVANATVLQHHLHSFGEHQGVTGVLLLSESHMSIHTWPEYQFAAIDIFMCGEHRMEAAVHYLKTAFNPQSAVIHTQQRGQPSQL